MKTIQLLYPTFLLSASCLPASKYVEMEKRHAKKVYQI